MAVTLLNTALLLVALNLIASLVLPFFEDRPRVIAPYRILFDQYPDFLGSAYPDWQRDELEVLLLETWSRPYQYEPFTQFRESPFQGRFVNVDEGGFRRLTAPEQGPWPIDPTRFNVFLFGGSTAFCYGLPDNETIAAHLQTSLRAFPDLGEKVSVYGFGRGAYYSTQERILFHQLLAEGAKPDLAVFLDGLNEFYFYDNRPQQTDFLYGAVEEQNAGPRGLNWRNVIETLPLTRLVRRLQPLSLDPVISESLRPVVLSQAELQERYSRPEALNRALDNYEANRRLIEATAQQAGVAACFFWQPIPSAEPADRSYPFTNGQLGRHNYSRFGYRIARERWGGSESGNAPVWLADLKLENGHPEYVDLVHYSAEMAHGVANAMAEAIRRQAITQGPLGELK